MITEEVAKDGVVNILASPDCPSCVEELLGKSEADKIIENYHAYPICKKHFDMIKTIENRG